MKIFSYLDSERGCGGGESIFNFDKRKKGIEIKGGKGLEIPSGAAVFGVLNALVAEKIKNPGDTLDHLTRSFI